MYNYDTELVRILTNTPAEVRRRLARYWGNQAEQVQIEAIKFAFDLLRQCGMENKEKLPEFFHSCFIKALGKMYYYETARAVRKKSDAKESDSRELRKVSEIRIERLKASKRVKPSPKTSKLLIKYTGLVRQLRSQGYGWRKVSDYLKRYNRLDVSHQTLYKAFRGNEDEKTQA